MENQKSKIVPLKNGPLKVTNLQKLTNSRNEIVELKKTIVLCRCGASKTKPFCDGTHSSIGFTDEKSKNLIPDKRDKYKGKSITIHDNRSVCAHAGFCTDNLPNVFRQGTEPWIDANAADIEDIKRVIRMCPSGALSYSENDGEVDNFFDNEEIIISKNGPYHVSGGIEITGVDSKNSSKEHYTLCRCGKSANKPRCDGEHWYAGFKDNEALTISASNRQREKLEPKWEKVAEKDELKDNGTKKLMLFSQQILLPNSKGKIQ